MKFPLLFIACAITSYSFSMKITFELPEAAALKAHIEKHQYLANFLATDLLERIANQQLDATQITAAIEASIAKYSQQYPSGAKMLTLQKNILVNILSEFSYRPVEHLPEMNTAAEEGNK